MLTGTEAFVKGFVMFFSWLYLGFIAIFIINFVRNISALLSGKPLSTVRIEEGTVIVEQDVSFVNPIIVWKKRNN